jgi:hypothetical protein
MKREKIKFSEATESPRAQLLSNPDTVRVERNSDSVLRRMFEIHAAQCPLVIAPYAAQSPSRRKLSPIDGKIRAFSKVAG